MVTVACHQGSSNKGQEGGENSNLHGGGGYFWEGRIDLLWLTVL
jgi:hypothetical protein